MTAFVIGFDLNKERQNYQAANRELSEAIKLLFATYWHHLDSTWIVVSDLSAAEVRDALAAYIDSDDELLVVQSAGVGAWKGINERGATWLQSHL